MGDSRKYRERRKGADSVGKMCVEGRREETKWGKSTWRYEWPWGAGVTGEKDER